ncbi:MAG: biliverdin-producing heme oxygenase [Phycisphaerae bacterium]
MTNLGMTSTESASSPVGIMARLREQTARHHQLAESRELEQALARGVLPRDRYVALLGQRWLIHRTLEARVADLCRNDPRLNDVVPPNLMQEPNLRADLSFFGVRPDEVPPLPATTRLIELIDREAAHRAPALLGCYYVFEGSKNGSRMLAPRVRKAYGIDDGGTRYFDPHGRQQRALWTEFKARMDGIPFTQPERDGMVEAACTTFDLVARLDDELISNK